MNRLPGDVMQQQAAMQHWKRPIRCYKELKAAYTSSLRPQIPASGVLLTVAQLGHLTCSTLGGYAMTIAHEKHRSCPGVGTPGRRVSVSICTFVLEKQVIFRFTWPPFMRIRLPAHPHASASAHIHRCRRSSRGGGGGRRVVFGERVGFEQGLWG